MVCFHCQQAAEKLLKAFLAAHAISPPLTHDLLLLLEKISTIRPDAEVLGDALALLTPYAVEVRYPDDSIMPSRHDALEAREAADEVRTWLRSVLPDAFADCTPQADTEAV